MFLRGLNKTKRRKQNITSALDIKNEIWGLTMHFLEIIKLQFREKTNVMHC